MKHLIRFILLSLVALVTTPVATASGQSYRDNDDGSGLSSDVLSMSRSTTSVGNDSRANSPKPVPVTGRVSTLKNVTPRADGSLVWDFEDADAGLSPFTAEDRDGDGHNWAYYNNSVQSNVNLSAHSGDGLVASASYINNVGALTPDNWLISPEVTLGGFLTFWASGYGDNNSSQYASEVFGVYVSVGDGDFVQVGADKTTVLGYKLYLYDLSAYEGQTGRFAIVHHNVTDMWYLKIDDIILDANNTLFFTVDGIRYLKNSDSGSVSVISYDENPEGSLIIPSIVNHNGIDYSVTSIGDDAFQNCTGLTSVTIPNSVTTIGNEAFLGCSGLTSIEIPNSVTTIGNEAFLGCSGLTSVVWNAIACNDFTSDNRPFKDLTSISSFLFGNEVEKIPAYLCNQLSGLTSIEIPNSVTSIGEGAFEGCSGLTSIEIPNSVTTISSYAFAGCRGLTSIEIPNSVTSIGDHAFYNCSGLTSVTIPNSVTYIYNNAFGNCSNLTSLSLTGKGAWSYNSSRHQGLRSIITQFKTVNIGSGITSLGSFGFAPDIVNTYAEVPPTCYSGTFSSYEGELHVPSSSTVSYIQASYWQNFANLNNDITSKVTLNQSDVSLVQWEELTFSATATPAGSELKWSSTNPAVAAVSENGVVTAVTTGECDIYATFASNPAVYATCHIRVDYPEITLILNESNSYINVGQEMTLTLTITPDNTGLTPTWTTSDETVAIVNNGVVTAMGEGECDITATVLDKTATCHVVVTGNVIISLDHTSAVIAPNDILVLTPSFSPDLPVDITVNSSNPDAVFARVMNGKVQVVGITEGTSTITVGSVDGKAIPATCEVTVALSTIPATSINLDKSEAEVTEGETLTLVATILPDNASIKEVTWSSSDESVATVNGGLVTAVAPGTATITATTTDGTDLSATCQLTVKPSATPGDVNGDGTINVGDYVNVASYILELDPQPFIFAAADLDGNNEINVGDLVGVAYLALNYEGAPRLLASVNNDAAGSVAMSAAVTDMSNGLYEVRVNLSNSVAITALQLDVTLPAGMTLVDASLTDRATTSHQLAFSELSCGDYRMLASSSARKSFLGDDDAVLVLTLAGTPNGTGCLSNIVLAGPDASTYGVGDLSLDFIPTGVESLYTSVRIYSEGGNIVIESPTAGTAQLVLPNGISQTVNVIGGRNVYPAPTTGLVIMKMGDNVKKMRF